MKSELLIQDISNIKFDSQWQKGEYKLQLIKELATKKIWDELLDTKPEILEKGKAILAILLIDKLKEFNDFSSFIDNECYKPAKKAVELLEKIFETNSLTEDEQKVVLEDLVIHFARNLAAENRMNLAERYYSDGKE